MKKMKARWEEKIKQKKWVTREEWRNRIRKRENFGKVIVVVFLLGILALELIKAEIIPYKNALLSCLKNVLPLPYPYLYSWYKNAYEFAGNSFTQVTAFYSAFSAITFFVIGRFKEGMLGVPLEELLDAKYDRRIIENRKKFVWFSPPAVCFCIILGAKMMAFSIGMLTLANVIFSAYCASIATDWKQQEKIIKNMVISELKEKLNMIFWIENKKKGIFIASDRYNSRTLSEIINISKDNTGLFFDIGERIFDWIIELNEYVPDKGADIAFYNTQSFVYVFLQNMSSRESFSYAFIFLEKQVTRIRHEFDEEKEKEDGSYRIYESVMMGIVCGVISSHVFGSGEFIENMFDTAWRPDTTALQKLNILLYLEHLYHNDEKKAAKKWGKKLLLSHVNFYGNIYNLMIDENKYYFLRYFILWENRLNGIWPIDLDIYYHLLEDIRTIDSQETKINSFIGGIIKEGKRMANEKYM